MTVSNVQGALILRPSHFLYLFWKAWLLLCVTIARLPVTTARLIGVDLARRDVLGV